MRQEEGWWLDSEVVGAYHTPYSSRTMPCARRGRVSLMDGCKLCLYINTDGTRSFFFFPVGKE